MKVFIKDIRKNNNLKELPASFNKQTNKYKNEKKIISHLAWQLLYDELLNMKINVNELRVENDSFGRPYFKDSNIYFNISHSNNLIVVGIGNKTFGLDIEFCKKRNNYLQLLKRIGLVIVDNQKIDNYSFYSLWTKYEACYKAGKKEIDIESLVHLYSQKIYDLDNLEYILSIDTEENIELVKRY